MLGVRSPALRRRRLAGGVTFPVAWSPAGDDVLVRRSAGPLSEPAAQLVAVPLRGGSPRLVAGTYGAAGGASWHC